ncbi:hypothetical protein CYY_005300 [Polysphondylium violaceum]|uniref:Uncharacterized protein n=1 Tax=Polysphondylium violaceum TaxID=133409 RepID=A0A8J4PTR0_9MYCE|nr:hypothetical protein CYY_005300 [Polysphondylium violaceum]
MFEFKTPQSKTQKIITPTAATAPSSPFVNKYLTPDNSLKKLYDLQSPDVLPQLSTNPLYQNVHSPPKEPLTVYDLRLICEKKFSNCTKEDLKEIIEYSKKKRYLAREWFLLNWFENDQSIPEERVLRTVYSIFCKLEKENDKLNQEFIHMFRNAFWKKLRKVTTKKRSRSKPTNNISKSLNPSAKENSEFENHNDDLLICLENLFL